MKNIVPKATFFLLILTACQQNPPITNNPVTPSNVAASAESSSLQYINWKTYEDATLGIRINYPSDEYAVTPIPFDGISSEGAHIQSDDFIQFGDSQITIKGIRIGDSMAEGNGVQIYRTQNVQILNYLQQYKPFTGKKTVNGIEYQQFEFIGMGDVYGYVTSKNGQYYIFESMWGPNNPVSEKMLQSLIFEN